MALIPENIPKGDRKLFISQGIANGRRPRLERRVQLALGRPSRRDAGQIALDVRRKDRHPRGGEFFGKHLKRHGFPGSRCPCYQPVAVAVFQQKRLGQHVIHPAAAHENHIRHLTHPC